MSISARYVREDFKTQEKNMSYLSVLLGSAYKEGMTEEEISDALEKASSSKKAPESTNDKDVAKMKAAFDKASAEASKYKKLLEERMTEDEKAKAERDEQWKRLVEDNENMKKRIAVAENKANLIALGYSETLAESTAEAMFSNDTATIFKNQKAMLEEREKALRAELVKGTPTPPAGKGSSAGMTKEQFDKLTTYEQMELYQKDPQLFEQLANS